MTELDTTPLTRREIRLAERALAAQAETERAQAHRALAAFADLPLEDTVRVDPPAQDSRPVPAPLPRRRDLRSAACPAPFAVVTSPAQVTRRDSRGTTQHRGRPSRPAGTAAAKGVLALTMSGAFLVSGLSYLQTSHVEAPPGLATAAEVKAQERAAEIAAERHQARLDDAATNRLTGQAAVYAAGRRAEALEVALASLESADTVAVDAQKVLKPTQVKPLDAAVQELAALVEASPLPDPTTTIAGADRTPAVSRSTRTSTEPVDTDADVDADVDAEQKTASTDEPELTSATSSPDAGVLPVPAESSAAAAPGQPSAQAPAAPSPLVALAADPEALDLAVTEELLVVAARVEKLSLEVKETAADVKAAKAAAQKAAAELERRVDATATSTNGAIDTDLLCAPDFEPDELVRCDAAEALEKLNDAYRADFGRDLEITSSYRSYASQVSTRASRGWLAAVPGTSNHGHAVAVDFSGFGGVGQFGSANYLWMKANAGRFGWVHPRHMEPGGGGPQEPWHWEYGTE